MAASTINSTTFTLTGPGGAVAGAVSYSGTTATFTPASVLTDGATYTATVTTGARDTDGNQLAAGSSWNFTATTALFKDAYGDPCNNSITTPVPGCTFNVNGGTRVTVSQDAHYNRYGNGTNDMMYVIFDGSGTGSVYNNLGVFQYNASVSGFAGYIGGTTIGVGTTGAFWESVADRTYWFGSNGVLYSANSGNANYGQAIN